MLCMRCGVLWGFIMVPMSENMVLSSGGYDIPLSNGKEVCLMGVLVSTVLLYNYLSYKSALVCEF